MRGKDRRIKYTIAAAVFACIAEVALFNISTLKGITYKSTVLNYDISISEGGRYETDDYIVNGYIHNVYATGLTTDNTSYAVMRIILTDEGDEYEYELPEERIVPGIKGSGYVNIYPYGKVHSIRVCIDVPEGASAHVDSISLNAIKPFDIKPARIFALWLAVMLVLLVFNDEFHIYFGKNDRYLKVFAVIICILFMVMGRFLSISNELIVACPWPHHKQYQELAQALSEGTVRLEHLDVSPQLLDKDNPYDTIALLAEGIPYNMDYAYYNGSYYVYFGIVPELLLYYPYYRITGGNLSNYNADMMFFILFVAGVFLCIWQLVLRFTPEGRSFPFALYLLMCAGICFLSNSVYLISRPDIYNIPIMAATAFTYMGTGLWLMADTLSKAKRTAALALGSLCMAAVAGCRPQMLIFSAVAIPIMLRPKDRRLFTRDTVADTIAFVLPYVIMAIPVCMYNYARFGNIFDFGATYSLTTNDMNHRGFNFNRLFRGLYCFFLQPAVMTTDFPYLNASVTESAYMGKNLTEFTYGGAFATNLIYLSIFVPVFKKLKGVKKETAALLVCLLAGALIIACFDVNGAGILYRYTCDMVPGLLLSAVIIWIMLIMDADTGSTAARLYVVLSLCGLFYAFMVFMAPAGSLNLKDNSVVLYETIRQYFRW